MAYQFRNCATVARSYTSKLLRFVRHMCQSPPCCSVMNYKHSLITSVPPISSAARQARLHPGPSSYASKRQYAKPKHLWKSGGLFRQNASGQPVLTGNKLTKTAGWNGRPNKRPTENNQRYYPKAEHHSGRRVCRYHAITLGVFSVQSTNVYSR